MKRILIVLAFCSMLCAPTLFRPEAAAADGHGNGNSSGCKGKVTICHRTGSTKNPFVIITVSCNALDAHLRHGDPDPTTMGGMPMNGMCGGGGD